MTSPQLLLIPTLKPSLALRCMTSLVKGERKHRVRAIAVYNGDNPSVDSQSHDSYGQVIGHRQAGEIVREMSNAAECPQELLFGRTTWGRSYGGASNLLLAIAWFLGPSIVARVDDDCVDVELGDSAWLDTAHAVARADTMRVHFGRSLIRPSGEVTRLPVSLSRRIGRITYSRAQRSERVHGNAPAGATLKNGILAFHTQVISRSCYAVLYISEINIHLRGEIYWWANGFADKRAFGFSPVLALGHAPRDTPNLEAWVRSTLAGADFWYVYRYRYSKGCHPSLDRRRARLRQIRLWARDARWPVGFDTSVLEALLDEQVQLPFSDWIHAQQAVRRAAWQRLLRTNGRSKQAILDAVSAKSSPANAT